MRQIILYLIVGSLVTGVDVFAYNVISRARFRPSPVVAHLLATGIAILFGFTFHYIVVFRPSEPDLAARMTKYVCTTLISAYLVQTSVIGALQWFGSVPVRVARGIAYRIAFLRAFSPEAIDRNFMKGCAVLVGLCVNFASFKWLVYA